MKTANAIIQAWRDFEIPFENTSYAFFAIEANMICMLILAILLSKQQAASGKSETQVMYVRSLFVQVLYCLSGILRVLVDINIIQKTPTSQYVITAVNFGLYACFCWLLFVYTAYNQDLDLMERSDLKIISVVPFLINILLLLLNPLNEFFVYFENNNLMPGALFSFMISINTAYPAAALILIVMHQVKAGEYELKNITLLSLYPVLFLIIAPLQALNWKVPMMCYAMTIVSIFIYISYADSLVSVDPLTKFANRNGLTRNLTERFRTGLEQDGELDKLSLLHLFAVDIDDLGMINSSYGRNEGDHALLTVAEALKKFRDQEHSCYIARYYGDEFMLVTNIKDPDELELFMEHVRNYINNEVVRAGLRYKIRVTIGYAKYETFTKTETLAGLIEESERSLNENKEQRKFQSVWQQSENVRLSEEEVA